MTASRIWTIILHRGGMYSSEIVIAATDHEEAHCELLKKYRQYSIIALIPGRHPSVYTFPVENNIVEVFSSSASNQPTGGSD